MKVDIKYNILKTYLTVLIFYSMIYYYMGETHFRLRDGSIVDSVYFSTTIMSTVGFGDIIPISDVGKMIVITHQITTIILAGALVLNF